jgi:hypothetical protein
MFLADRLTLDKPRRTKEGFLAVRAKAAKSGVYDYLGHEVDPSGEHFKADQVVKVYRPEDEVFAKDSVHSFLLKPITDNHPIVPVTADNWRQYAKGVNAGAIRDGEYLAFDLVLMDASAIDAVDSGKRELSNGYSCELEIGDGVAPDGTAYHATQRKISGNHIALVKAGRAGPECRIGDAATCNPIPVALLDRLLDDGRTYNASDDDANLPTARRETSHFEEGSQVATKTITFDGLPVEVTDAAEAVIRKLEGKVTELTDAKGKADAKVGELTATISTKDGEIAALQQNLKDAEVTPEKLQSLVADRAALVDAAKKIVPSIVTDGKTDIQIRKAVVDAKLGDAAKDMDDAAIAGAFKAFAAVPGNTTDTVREVITNGVTNIADGKALRDAARNSRYA